jgi:type I restriction enzyme, S subunit
MTNSLLLEHFDQLISIPDDVELLDRAILYLALQGKLVHQNPNDESATELINRIRESNQIQKASTKDTIEEKPYDLPLGWIWTTLPEIGEVNPRNHEDDDTKESSFIPMTYIPEEYAGELKFDIRPWGEIRKGFTHLRENDVAVAKITPCFENGKAVVMKGLINGIGAGTTELHVFRGNPDFILPDYVLMFFKNYKFREDGKRKMTGSAGQQRVPKEHITLTPFPLPPYAEQQRIVARVKELFVQTHELAKELENSQIELDGLNKSALSHLLASETSEEFNQHWDFIAEHFDLLFQTPEHIAPLRQSILELAVRGKLTRREAGDESAKELLKRISIEKEKPLHTVKDDEKPSELPDGWIWTKFESIANIATNSVQPDKYRDYPHVAPNNIEKGTGRLLDYHTVAEDDVRSINHRFFAGQLLYSKIRPNLSKAVIVDFEGLCSADMYPLDVFIDTQYLLYFILSSVFLGMVTKNDTRVAMPKVNQNELNKVLIAVPPLAEQERIVKRVEQLLSWCDALEEQLKSAEEERARLVESVLVLSTVEGLARVRSS